MLIHPDNVGIGAEIVATSTGFRHWLGSSAISKKIFFSGVLVAELYEQVVSFSYARLLLPLSGRISSPIFRFL